MDILTRFSPDESDDAAVDALAHVTIAEVAERAGVTKSRPIYHVWPSQEAFRRDLLALLLDRGRQLGVEQLGQLIELSRLGDEPLQVLYKACDLAFDMMKNDPLFLAQFSFYLYTPHPSVSELLALGDEQVVRSSAEQSNSFSSCPVVG